WHTMTRSGTSPRLALHSPEPFVEIDPADARAHGLTAGGFARVTTEHGKAVLKVVVSEGQRAGSLFAPIHWSAATAASARIGDLVAPVTAPPPGQPDARAAPAAISTVAFAWGGFALTRRPGALPATSWWARVAIAGGVGYLLATNETAVDWREAARTLLG